MKLDINNILALIAGLAAAIPTVIMLGIYIRKAIKEGNWPALLRIMINLMTQAEQNFDNGADRKQWVMTETETAAKTIGYNADMNAISLLIDSLCAMAKLVNVQPKT